MPIAYVLLTDTLDQWRQKTNQMVDLVNTLSGAGSILAISGPTTGQILVCDGTVFRNVSTHGDVYIYQDGTTALNYSNITGFLSKGRVRFAGSMARLY
jgi:hypothetical protein